jgi:hypothetical protein
MPSRALTDFRDRLDEIEQLVQAHGALVRLKRAEAALEAVGGDLTRVGAVVNALVTEPGVGRPPEVQALNSAAVALLSGHLQGFATDLFSEAARHLLAGHVPDIEALLGAANTRGNPNEHNINQLFSSIGFANVLQGVSWRRMSNDAFRRKLREFNELRNRIVHGRKETVRKSQVTNYMSAWSNFATRLDQIVGRGIQAKTGTAPW